MPSNKVVAQAEWIEARKSLLEQEKEFTRARDALSRKRRELPWEEVQQSYVFAGPEGDETLAELFDGRSQLIVYHFMYGPDWEAGCKSCSFLTDHFEPAIVHLNQRDVSMVAVSKAPLPKLEAFKKRMGWSFKWLSSLDNDFNRDYHVSFTEDEIERGDAYYNYKIRGFPSTEAPGLSVFFKDEEGRVFHTYSAYERGLDMLITTYHYLDLVPKGRDEDSLSFTMEWVRLHDEYGG
jgi:predicted dithiol-disulfide oxidoreductase (DUF899 family)